MAPQVCNRPQGAATWWCFIANFGEFCVCFMDVMGIGMVKLSLT